jgi:hypothetical protein
MITRKDRIITSDLFLQQEGYMRVIRKIKKDKGKRVVIIGGSHSGFSAAWMLLHGPADLWHNTAIVPKCA